MSELLKKINVISGKISVKKDGKNPFYRSKYVTLDNIMEKLKPLLDEQGLMVYNYNLKDWGVRTIVTDFTDSVSSDFVVWDVKDPQQLWKVLTYWRRYNLVSLFNILADEDDDAQSFYDDKPERNYETTKKYDKKIFGLKEFENLKKKKEEYTFEQVRDMIKKDYSCDESMADKIGGLYGKKYDKINGKWKDLDINDLF